MSNSPTHPQLFLREEELRRGMELLFFAYRGLISDATSELAKLGFGQAHRRALYFISQSPGLAVKDLLLRLNITKQSLSRVLKDLTEGGFISQTPGNNDRRQRLLFLTETGIALEKTLFDCQKDRVTKAYKAVGAEAVDGFWQVLIHMLDPQERKSMGLGQAARHDSQPYKPY